MSAFDVSTSWWLALAGWSVVVALWHTSAVALALATWQVWRRGASARGAYLAASAALALALVLTLATPFALRWQTTTITAADSAAPSAVAPHAPAPASPPLLTPATGWSAVVPSGAIRAVPWIGAFWCGGILVALVRLAGGWGLTLWIRRRATRVESPNVLGAAAHARARWDLPPAALLSSEHVDAPVVVGARAPAILLPVDLERRLGADALPPLLAHELAHVRRRDYASNLAQSIADAVLWFSPGARYVSRCIREAREYCCDDVVASRCGVDAYAAALTTLAGLGVAARQRPAVHAAGPRLIVRIRRLLQEDSIMPFRTVRLAGIAGALVLVAGAGRSVVSLSAAGVAQATPITFTTPVDGPVPMGFVAMQPGAAMRVRDMTTGEQGYCGTATLENLANVAVTGVSFAAHIIAHGPERSSLMSVAYTASPHIEVHLPPGGIADVTVDLVSLDDLRQMIRTGRPQVMCALTEIRYANGSAWSAPPASAFAPANAEVSRTLLDGVATPGAPVCRDQTGAEYSENAIVPIALEPGTFARCHEGAWSESQLPPMRPDPAR